MVTNDKRGLSRGSTFTRREFIIKAIAAGASTTVAATILSACGSNGNNAAGRTPSRSSTGTTANSGVSSQVTATESKQVVAFGGMSSTQQTTDPTSTRSAAPTQRTSARQGTSNRSKTVIFDIDSGRVQAPTLMNPYAVGANDVVFTINMLVNGPAELLYAASMQQWVDSVKKVDKQTVQFKLKDPDPRFQLDYFSCQLVNSVLIVPEHIWKGQDPLKFKNFDLKKGWPVFTGPYKLTAASQTAFEYERDPNWWGAKTGFKPLPKPERLTWTANDTEDIKVARAAQHQLDSVMDITLGGFQSLQQRNKYIIAWYDHLPYAWVDPCARQLSLNDAVEPWNDKEMRWALNYAINRDQIVKIAYEGTTVPSTFMYPAYPPLEHYMNLLDKKGLYKKYPIQKYDQNKATQILESKGYKKGSNGTYQKNGKDLTLEILTDQDYIELKRISQVVVQQLQNFGIKATMPILSGNTWGDKQAFGKYAAAMAWNSCGSVVEPWTSMDHYNIRWYAPIGKRASDNPFRWKNKQYSGYVDQMGALSLDDPKIDDLFLKAAVPWMEDLPIVPLTQAKKLIPFDTYYWTGWPTSKNFYAHPETWWGTTHIVIHNLQPTGR